MDCVLKTIAYIESNLDAKLGLEEVANAVYYSKYHLHRTFADTVGISVHSYAQRRQLTEAARLLAETNFPILDIALRAGYESQQSFSKAFKRMYKQTPLQLRRSGAYYPLQLPFALANHSVLLEHTRQPFAVGAATEGDIQGWMELVRLTVDGFPFLQEAAYVEELRRYIREGRALIMKRRGIVTGVLLHSGSRIDFFAVHPFYRNHPEAKAFLDVAAARLPAREITTTTYRAGDPADIGYRGFLARLGFREGPLLVEFGYPTQEFILPRQQTA